MEKYGNEAWRNVKEVARVHVTRIKNGKKGEEREESKIKKKWKRKA